MKYTYKQTKLDNGLKVISATNKNINASSIELWIKAGSRFEKEKELAHAHILEHMLLKGTEKRPTPTAVRKEIDRLGAYSNASTSREYTKFYFEAVNDHAEKIFDLLSDIILNSLLDKNRLEREKEVILEELSNYLNTPRKKLAIKSLEEFFGNHPLSSHPLGKEKVIKSTKPEDLKKYLDKYYKPEKAAIITSGGLSHEKVVSFAEKYFSKWKNKEKVEKELKKEIQLKEHNYFIKEDIEKYLFYINFKTTGSSNKSDMAALHIISEFLSGGSSSYLTRKLRHDKGLIYSIGTKNVIYTDTGRFLISTASTKPKRLLNNLDESLDKLNEEFTKNIFKEVKEQSINKLLMSLVNPLDVAGFMGRGFVYYENLFSPQDYIKNIKEVDYKKVQEVIKKYFKDENKFIATSGPKKI